jgi:putative two-component system response regulator
MIQFSMANGELTGDAFHPDDPTGAALNLYANGDAPNILVLDSNEMNRRMLKAILKTASYRIHECAAAAEAMAILEKENIDVIVLDLMLPEISGPDFCRWLRSNRKTKLIPTLMLTNVLGVDNEIEGITSGADEFLIKPVHARLLRARIAAMLRTKALIDSLEEAETILFALARAIEHRDKNTGAHCERLADYSVKMGEALGLSALELTALYRGGFLHDIGKISVPDAILFKPGKLTPAEWDVMRKHTIQGEAMCRHMKSLAPVLPIIRNHHERWDGTGYPDGLKGEEIPLLARILQVVDIYDALTTARPYKPALPPQEAVIVMRQEVACGWRDPVLTKLFIDQLEQAPPPRIERADESVTGV